MEHPPKKFFRLAPGQMVRLKSAYIIKCDEVLKNADGSINEIRCTYFPESKSGADTSGLQVKGTLHWVAGATAVPVEVRLYDRLFKVEDLSVMEGDFRDYLNPDSLRVISNAFAEPALKEASASDHYQFLRMGYYYLDPESNSQKLVFNRTVTLRDMWAKETKKS